MGDGIGKGYRAFFDGWPTAAHKGASKDARDLIWGMNDEFDGVTSDVREFPTGATRDLKVEKDGSRKLEYAQFFSPVVLQARAKYMDKHREKNGVVFREGDNWKGGFTDGKEGVEAIKDTFGSHLRHVIDQWMIIDGREDLSREEMVDTICAQMFNLESMLLTILEKKE